jgi:hypothetical protein
MAFQFKKHYTREEAEALLPQIREWLADVSRLRSELTEFEARLSHLLKDGEDLGGDIVNGWLKALVRMKDVLREFKDREIQIKDLDRGLIDFPAFVGGQEVFLCWEKDEDAIEYWHDLTSGYSGRERL